jgi:DNA-directed RNA polymerase subunit RPC12/RpoP
MVGMQKRGAYGEGGKIKDWNEYNPWGYKITKFKEESVCAICGSKADVIFPVTIEACPDCAQKIMERKDVYWTAERKIDITGRWCQICGRFSIVYWKINTRICHKCTINLGKNQRQYLEWLKLARKVDRV